ncbi:hypothetical protein C8Q79DRAFT_962854 [Trametes meyenii]|nr:hypothetical protein C8Q79DRAFT_962854 [Trametes meyenii]
MISPISRDNSRLTLRESGIFGIAVFAPSLYDLFITPDREVHRICSRIFSKSILLFHIHVRYPALGSVFCALLGTLPYRLLSDKPLDHCTRRAGTRRHHPHRLRCFLRRCARPWQHQQREYGYYSRLPDSIPWCSFGWWDIQYSAR